MDFFQLSVPPKAPPILSGRRTKRRPPSNSSNLTSLSKSCTSIPDKLLSLNDRHQQPHSGRSCGAERNSARHTPTQHRKTEPPHHHRHQHHAYVPSAYQHCDAYEASVADEIVRDYMHYRNLRHLDDDCHGHIYHRQANDNHNYHFHRRGNNSVNKTVIREE